MDTGGGATTTSPVGNGLRLSSDVSEPIWQELKKRGCIDEVLVCRSSFEDLVADAKATPEYRQAKGVAKSPPGRRPQEIKEHFEVELNDKERERAAALSDVLAHRAATHYAVVRFRREF